VSIAAFRTNQDLDERRLREAFGHFPSGVVAVAALVDGAPVGLAASSFTSVSLDPPLVSVSVANTSRTWPVLSAAPRLGVTVLAAHHGDACRRLAGPVEHRFDGLAWTVRPQGAVVLDDGLAQFDCSIHREVEAGDHTIVLLELHAVAEHVPAEPDAPLLFHRSRLGPIAG
jgi:flavin reductase (DIM6/NTAB) family NADH-FMN oxidoreductase RutF